MIAPKDRQAVVTDYFEKDAPFWEKLYERNDVFSMIHRERAVRAMSEIGRLPLIVGSRVLEVGCGAGLFAVRLARRGFLVEATDPTAAMIERTRRNAEAANLNGRLHAGIEDVHALQYPEGTFDLVVALGVLPWLHDPALALREMARVIRPGGYLVTSSDNRARLTHLLDPLFNPLLQPIRHSLGRGRSSGPSANTVWSRALDQDLKKAGLQKQRSFTFGFGPFTFMGRPIVREKFALALHSKLQKLANERLPLLRATGTQYMVVAKKEP